MLTSRNIPPSGRWSGWGARIYLGCIVSAVGQFAFEFGRYVPAGTAIKSTGGIAGGKRWEVWFRKNADAGEPFAAGLFIEQAPNEWGSYLFDFQAIRSPRFTLRAEGTNWVVLRGTSIFGTLDQQFRQFREPDGRNRKHPASCTANHRETGG